MIRTAAYSIAAAARDVLGFVTRRPNDRLRRNTALSDEQRERDKGAKVGRHDPCPCKSGRWLKDCCIWPEQAERRRREKEQGR